MKSFPNLRDGRKTVTAAGTAERLVSSHTNCYKVEITALEDNADIVVVGNSTVVADLTTRRGTPLTPGQTLTLYVEDLYAVYLDAVSSGDGVSYSYTF